MNENKKNVPKLRFPGFTDAWEQRKVVDLSEATYGGGTPQTSIKAYWEGEIPWIQSSDLKEHEVSGVEPNKRITQLGLINSATKLVPANSIAIITRVGVGKLAFMPYEYATSQDFLSLSKLKVDEWFAVYSLYKKLQSELHAVQGTSIKGITKVELLSKSLMIPGSNVEQQQIGAFFAQLDNLITLHQRKLNNVKKLKAGLLQKMFPKNGEECPEIRFPGFTDAWEQRKLGDVTKTFSGGTPSVGKSEYYNGDIPFIRSAEINSDSTELFITKSGLNNSSAKMVEVGDILYALYGATSGEVGISRINGAINQAILAIQSEVGYDTQFIMQWLRNQKQKIIDKYLQGGQGNLSGSIVKDLQIEFPNYEEQQQIGAFFAQLDNLITLHQRKLDNLREQKKALLQQMFV